MISIIIRTYNEEKHLEDLLTMILKQVNVSYEIVIVDSGSNDNTLDIAKKYGCKIIQINKKDFTFGYSLNKGIENASGEFCVFVSGHCIPVNTFWLYELIKPFGNEKIGLVYGRQIGNEVTKISERMIFNKWFPSDSTEIQKNPFNNNANAAIRKSIWDVIKYNEIVTGLEDLVFAEEILKQGWLLSYNANSVVYHIHNESYKQIMRRYEREAITFKTLYPHEKFSLFEFIKLSVLNIFVDINNNKINIKNIISIIKFRTSQFWGTYIGYKEAKHAQQLKNRFYYP